MLISSFFVHSLAFGVNKQIKKENNKLYILLSTSKILQKQYTSIKNLSTQITLYVDKLPLINSTKMILTFFHLIKFWTIKI